MLARNTIVMSQNLPGCDMERFHCKEGIREGFTTQDTLSFFGATFEEFQMFGWNGLFHKFARRMNSCPVSKHDPKPIAINVFGVIIFEVAFKKSFKLLARIES